MTIRSLAAPQVTEASVKDARQLARRLNDITEAIGSLSRAVSSSSLYGPYASRPSVSNLTTGTRYVCSDGCAEFINDGTSWRPVISGVIGTEPCPSNRRKGFSQVGLTPTTVNVTSGSIYTYKTLVSSNSLSGFEVSKPGSSQFTVHFVPNIIPLTDTSTGVGLPCIWVRDTSGGKLEGIFFGETGTFLKVPTVTVYQYTNLSTFSSEPAGQTHGIVMPVSRGMWFRIKDSGTGLVFSYSWDGVNYNTVFTDNVPYVPGRGNAFGFGVNANSASAGMFVDSLQVI